MNIHDIARLAGVSASTVSKVMNGKDRDISEETKKKVLAVIEKENYVPYFKFREKEGLKSHLLGLIIRRDHRERETIVLSAEQAASSLGYSIVVSYAEKDDDLSQYVDEMVKRQVCGLIIDSEKKVDCGRLERVTAYLSQTKEFDERQQVTFYYRLSEAGRLATERLMEEGHQKIACIVHRRDGRILDGYRLAVQSCNLPLQSVWSYEGDSIENIEFTEVGTPKQALTDVAISEIQVGDDTVLTWEAEEGENLRELLTKWSAMSGWKLLWNTNRNYILSAGVMFKGKFADVSSALIRAFARARPAPIATYYKGNRVIVVETMENENAY